MPQTVTQNLTIPANVTNGGGIQAGDVSTLYNTLNALSIPDAVAAAFVNMYSTGTGITLTGGTSTAAAVTDVSLSAAVAAAKTMVILGSYAWATTGLSLQLTYRWNASSTGSTAGQFASPATISTTTSGNGLFLLFMGPRDANVPTSIVGWQTGSTGNVLTFTASTNLSTGNSTQFGLGALFGTATNGSTSSTVTWQYAEIWRKQ